MGRLVHKVGFLVFGGALLLFPLSAALWLMSAWTDAEQTQELFAARLRNAKPALERKELMERFWGYYANPKPYFLDQEIEGLEFLRHEREQLSAWANHPGLFEKKAVQERLNFLQSGENRLIFGEERVQVSSLCKETLEVQRRPVEMGADELREVLARIENLQGQAERPQLLVSELHVVRKTTPLHHETLEVQMRILKREFL